MSITDHVANAIDTVTGIGELVSTVMGDAFSTLADIEGAGGLEIGADSELWGSAALLERPLAGAEVLFLRDGDDLIGIVTKDRRWQIDLEEGEVVLRAFGENAAMVHLKPDGECVIIASNIKVGSSATEGIGLGDVIKTYLDSLKSWVDAHIHVTTATIGSGATVGVISPSTPPSPAVPVVASSKHQVES